MIYNHSFFIDFKKKFGIIHLIEKRFVMKKDLLKLRKALSMLGISISLVSSGCGTNEISDINTDNNYNLELEVENERLKEKILDLEEQLEKAETAYKEEDLYIAFVNDGDGVPKYRFVTEDYMDLINKDNYNLYLSKYKYVTDEDKALYSKKWYYRYNKKRLILENMPFTEDVWLNYWIPNYKKFGNVIRVRDFILPNEYQYKNSYSLDDIKYLENLINEPGYDVWEYLKEVDYDLTKLFVIEIEGKFYVFSDNLSKLVIETNNIENIEDLRMDYYFYNITNPVNAVKGIGDISYVEYFDDYYGTDKVVDVNRHEFTSLDKNSDWVKYDILDSIVYKNIYDLLPKTYNNKRKVTYDEIVEIENYLNNKNDYTLKKTK